VVLPIAAVILCNIIFWLKGNAKPLWGVDWSPFKWWATTSLLTNYLMLTSWWRAVELLDIWKATFIWGAISVAVGIPLNGIFYGFNSRGVLAALLILVAGFVIR
jgi:hypothetical protein